MAAVSCRTLKYCAIENTTFGVISRPKNRNFQSIKFVSKSELNLPSITHATIAIKSVDRSMKTIVLKIKIICQNSFTKKIHRKVPQ